MKSLKLSTFAFTIIELIFVIVVIGILAYVGSKFIPDNRLAKDTNFLIMKIKEKQKNAIGYNLQKFGQKAWSSENSYICIELDISKLEEEDLLAQKPYKFSSKLSVEGNKTICFDNYGRPYESAQLLLNVKDINLSRKKRVKRLKLYPISGYIEVYRP